ncbi:unnamed protein product [Mesocestoides corti]|nr:unnamed protein product [Mesocestoides corti]
MGLVKQVVKVLGPRIDNVVCCTPLPTAQEIAEFPDLFSEGDIVPTGQSEPKLHTFHGPRTNEPNDEVIKSSLMMAQIASKMNADDMLIVCITGGGSALLTLPYPINASASLLDASANRLPLKAITETSKLLSLEGASIQELNSVRSCLDTMKAGGLARFASPAQVVSLILSDVIGDPLEFIASGPTYVVEEDTVVSSIDRAIAILHKYKLREKIPSEVKKFLEMRQRANTILPKVNPKPANRIIGNLAMSLEEAAREAAKLNPTCLESKGIVLSKDIFRRTPVESFETVLPIILTNTLAGDVSKKAKAIADLAWDLRKLVQLFLRKPDYTTRHVNEETRNRILATQKRITDKKEYYRDLVQGCYQVAKAVNGLGDAGRKQKGRFLGGLCLLLGGEATVKVRPVKRPEPANGGRCSHAALTASLRWYDLRSGENEHHLCRNTVDMSFFARASDGLDGPSAFGAGAWSSMWMIRDASEAEFAKQCLEYGDSYGFFTKSKLEPERGHYLPARLTGTNVMDLFMCLINVYA